MFIPKSPYKHIKWSLHVYVGHGRQKWQGQWHECWGLESRQGEQGREKQTERQTTEVSDICSRQLMTPGWPGGVRGDWGPKGVDNSHKCCNGWYFKFNSFPGSDLLYPILFTQNFLFTCFFDLVLNVSTRGEDGFKWNRCKNSFYKRDKTCWIVMIINMLIIGPQYFKEIPFQQIQCFKHVSLLKFKLRSIKS